MNNTMNNTTINTILYQTYRSNGAQKKKIFFKISNLGVVKYVLTSFKPHYSSSLRERNVPL